MLAYVINPGSSSTRLALADIQPSETPGLPGQLRLTLQRAELTLPESLAQFTPLSPEWVAALVTDLYHATRDWRDVVERNTVHDNRTVWDDALFDGRCVPCKQ